MTVSIPRPVKMVVLSGFAALVGLSGAGSAAAAPRVASAPAVSASAVRSLVTEVPVTCRTDGSRAAADAYLDALVSHDATAVPFATDVLRVENGLVTGRTGEEIRNDLNTSWKYKIIVGLRDRTYTETPPTDNGTVTVNVDYLLDIGFHSTTLLTVRVKERFDVQCGQITYINANIGL